jgi:hypothetical protein
VDEVDEKWMKKSSSTPRIKCLSHSPGKGWVWWMKNEELYIKENPCMIFLGYWAG